MVRELRLQLLNQPIERRLRHLRRDGARRTREGPDLAVLDLHWFAVLGVSGAGLARRGTLGRGGGLRTVAASELHRCGVVVSGRVVAVVVGDLCLLLETCVCVVVNV